MNTTNWQQLDIRLFAVAASLVLSAFTVIFASLPNDDAYTYIKTAEIFLEQGVGAAIAHYTWAGYPILIGLVSMTGVSLFSAAYLLNALFFAVLVYSFISIVRQLDDSRTILWLAALTVLAYPELNEYRDVVVRDVGFWSLLVLGLWRFMVFMESRQFKHGAFFVIAMLAAMVFRVEAVAYLAAIPFALFLQDKYEPQQNRKDFFSLAGLIAAVGLAGFLVLLASGINLLTLFLDLITVYQPFINSLFKPDEATTAAQATAIFGEYAGVFSRDYVSAVIAVGLSVVLVMTLFYTIGGPYFWLLVFGMARKHLKWNRSKMAPLLVVMLVNLFILIVFLYITRFLTGRYALLLALMLVTTVPFLVKSMIERYRDSKWEQLNTYFLVLFFFYCLIDAYVSFGRSKDWLLDAAAYVETEVAAGTPVLTNNHTIAYFSGKVEEYDTTLREIEAQSILDVSPGTIIALEMYYEMTVLVEQQSVQPYLELLQVFPSEDDPQAAIYRRIN